MYTMVDKTNDIEPHLRFAPDILRRLGEELIPNPEQGLIELVKNAYDADAPFCTVTLDNATFKGGNIIIEDGGDGMAKEDLLNGFLIIGRSRKVFNKPSPIFKRLPVGDKGLGRIAALRLGQKVIVKSRPKSSPGTEFTLEIDWKVIDKADVIEDVVLTISESLTDKGKGVTIELLNLRKALSKYDVQRLTRELLLLADPFKSTSGFRVELIAPEFKSAEELLKKSYFVDADYYLSAKVDKKGNGHVVFADMSGVIIAKTDLPLNNQAKYDIPPSIFELWIYRFGTSFTLKPHGMREVQNWIKSFGGVHIYHRGLRVRPYGDPGSDWLDMNLSRVSHPELRPSTQTSIGRVITEDPTLKLGQPTNRIGFVEDNTFFEMKRFGQDVLRWTADFRLKEAEKARAQKKIDTKSAESKALKVVTKLVRATVPKSSVGKVEKAIQNYAKARENEVLALREDLQLYRSLATAGTTAAVFAHEAAKPITLINAIANTIEFRGRKHLAELYNSILDEPVSKLKDVSKSLTSYSQFPIHHLRNAKRRQGAVMIYQTWKDIKELFTPLLEQAKIVFDIEFDGDKPAIQGSIALIEAIATNLITNSIHALTKTDSRMVNRLISVSGEMRDDSVLIVYSDNGPGISLDIEDIWLPGKTTNPQGTGLGLTIVRDSIQDLHGSIKAVSHGKLGGAEFTIEFPLSK